jgi:hypothetical protein
MDNFVAQKYKNAPEAAKWDPLNIASLYGKDNVPMEMLKMIKAEFENLSHYLK